MLKYVAAGNQRTRNRSFDSPKLRSKKVCCGVLHRVAACRSVLQPEISGHGAGRLILKSHAAKLYVAICCSVLQCVAVCCSVLQCVAVRCSALQCFL